MAEYSVVVTDHDFDDLSTERSILSDVATVCDYTADIGKTDVDASTLRDADAILNLRASLDVERVSALENCRVIARYGIGVDNVAVDAATECGIPVTNVPGYCIEEVATHATTLGMSLLRGLKPYDTSVAAGDWSRDAIGKIRRVSELTVGIVGYGTIGRAVGKRTAAFGADVVASDPYLKPADLADDPATLVSFEQALEDAHLVSIHSPLTDETRGLFDADAFGRMRDDAYLVNVARGPIVNDEALASALDDGDIAGAGLDVFPDEPPAADHPLRDRPDVVATPHVAWYSREANDERRRTAAEIVRAALNGESLENVVNDVDS